MNGMAEMKPWMESLGWFLVSRTIDLALVLAIAALVWKTVHKKVPAQFGYYLFLLVLLKPIVPAQIPLSLPLSGWMASTERIFSCTEKLNPVSPVIEENTAAREQMAEEKPITAVRQSLQNNPQGRNDRSALKTKITKRDTPSFQTAHPTTQSNHSNSIPNFVKPIQTPEAASQRETPPPAASAKLETLSTIKSQAVHRTTFATDYENFFPSFTWKSAYVMPALLLVWIVGVLFLSIRFAYEEWRTFRTIQDCNPVDSGSLPVCFRQLLHTARVRRRVRLATGAWVKSPFVYGIVKPTLFIPKDFSTQYSANQIRWILLHELAHIRRWDTLVKIYQKIIQFIFFFHPAVWIAGRMVDRQREYACDAAAVHGSNISPHDCGESFLRVVFQTNGFSNPALDLLGLTHSKHVVKERLMRILEHHHRFKLGLSPLMAALLFAVTFAVLSFGGAVKAEVSQAAEPAVTVNPASAKPSIDFPAPPYSTEGWTLEQPGNQYVWRKAVQIKPENLTQADLATQDGDIVIKPLKDPSNIQIDAESKIIIRASKRNADMSGEEILAIKKEVEALTGIQDKTFFFHSAMPGKIPEGVSISVNLTVYLPPSLAVKAKSEDGDVVAEGIENSLALSSQDGDIIVNACRGPVIAGTEDGDIVLTEILQNAEAKSQDGDVVVTKCQGTVLAITEDGDIVLTEIQQNAEAKTQDGDVVVTKCQGTVLAIADDGDIVLTEIQQNAEAKAQDGDITVTQCQGTVLASTKDGDIALTSIEKAVEASADDGDIIASDCGGTIRAKTGTGDITLTNIAESVDVTTHEGDIVTSDCPGPIHAVNESGSIVIENAEKKVEAATKEGDITVTYSNPPTDSCLLKTTDGEVTVSLPGESKTTLDLRCNDGEIDFDKTDFIGDVTEKSVKGTLNGGGAAITIQTESGNISLRKE